MSAYIDKLSDEQRILLESEEDLSSLIEIYSKLAEEFVVRQRRKSKENELTAKYPDAPTTGFEFEYVDSLRAITNRIDRIPREIKILEILRDENWEKLNEEIKEKIDIDFINHFMQEFVEKNKIIDSADYAYAISTRQERLQHLKYMVEVNYHITGGLKQESDYRSAVKKSAAASIEQMKKMLEGFKLSHEVANDLSEMIRRQADLIEGKIEFQVGEQPDTGDLRTMRMLVPSPAERLSQIGPFSAKPELYALEETITKPSVSVRMQLRDFIYAAKMGAFKESINVHQNIGGIELSPDDTEFMEVTALLDAADWNGPEKEFSEHMLQSIGSGENIYSDPFKKISECSNGKQYYFPYHKNKKSSESKSYPSTPRPLLEMRAKRAFDVRDSFSTHVRASTFTWLAAWGKQAANIAESDRTEQQKQLAEAWETLQYDWSSVLASKNIYQPKGDERYQEIVDKDGILEFVGEEKYSLFLEKIMAKNFREKTSGQIRNKDSLRSQARNLITEYNKKVNKIIGY